MTDRRQHPIGVFDSGLGGLTVVRELSRRLPHEDIIYVGDTARVPYGTKSPDTIRRYALQIAFTLLQRKVKLIVVACNTASALALKSLRSLPIPVVGVIAPGARAAVEAGRGRRIGVIGTKATVASGAYEAAIHALDPRASVWQQACPLFVPLVEEGWTDTAVTRSIARTYLTPLLKRRVEALVLGCTHYPLLKKTLAAVAGPRVALIDSAEETAKDVEAALSRRGLLSASTRRGRMVSLVTDHPEAFSRLGARFLGRATPAARRLMLDAL